jgi:hypothetical protein
VCREPLFFLAHARINDLTLAVRPVSARNSKTMFTARSRSSMRLPGYHETQLSQRPQPPRNPGQSNLVVMRFMDSAALHVILTAAGRWPAREEPWR